MRRKKHREIDFLGIFLGLIIGCLLGFFLSGKVNMHTTDVFGESKTETKDIFYILQEGSYDNVESARVVLEKVTAMGFPIVVIKEYRSAEPQYNIYMGMSKKEAPLAKEQDRLRKNGIVTTIKKRNIYDCLEILTPDNIRYSFWEEALKNLLNSLENKEIIISEKHQLNPVDIETFSYVVTLKSLKNAEIELKYQLELYRAILENIY